MSYFVYMLLCQDGSFYLGSTNDIEKRFRAHQSGKGANYTRSHKPVRVVYTEELPDKSAALRREHELKKLTHQAKHRFTIDFGSSLVNTQTMEPTKIVLFKHKQIRRVLQNGQ